ncbi:alpha/beta fold hydrolase [Nocardia spumae]|uniref:alpha/beta hydrolase n=1 Tax=Nocardia spumae TaxID=2887190 RepID=UPI001D1549F2|nr:alpha/beta fold hydrolase [Nocardia spumae]
MNRTEASSVGAAVVEMMCAGRFHDARERFGPSLRSLISADKLAAAWESEIGPDAAIEATDTDSEAVVVRVRSAKGAAQVLMSLEDGRVTGLRIARAAPAWLPPDYAKTEFFDEEEVCLGHASDSVPGALCVPRGAGPHPAVVLLSGGGPFDRDGTTGPNKPMKDIAWGLAAAGVVVLRFDKPSYRGAAGIAPTADYVPPAVAAVRRLRERDDVDPARVFVLGHSMGGRYAPRVAVAEPGVAGLVLLAADTQPMQRAAVRVGRYLMSVAPESARAWLPDPEELLAQAARVEDPDLPESTPADELPLGLPARVWLDLRAYDPVATAVAAHKPMLILQGGRDYQVTVADDLSGWREGLGDRADVDIRVYEAVNHMFVAGTGRSTPAEYQAPGHVDGTVVADIAEWLSRGR